jgi:hypothetical protein
VHEHDRRAVARDLVVKLPAINRERRHRASLSRSGSFRL